MEENTTEETRGSRPKLKYWFGAVVVVVGMILISLLDSYWEKKNLSQNIKLFDDLTKLCEKYEGGTIITSPNDINCWTKFGTYQWDRETNEFINREILK